MTQSMTTPTPTPTPRNPVVTAVVDYLGPAAFLVGFFLTHRSLTAATWWLVGGSAGGLLVGLAVNRRIAPLPAIWGAAALLFGLLTLFFHDTRIIKMKTTVIDAGLAVILIGGLRLGKNPLKLLMGETLKVSDAAWRTLTWRYAGFFLAMAALNELIWRTQPETTWVLFRMPGLLILALVFSAFQVPLMLREMKTAEAAANLVELQE